jgi:hypothetical protein
VTDQEPPEYLRVADWVLDGIASGSIGGDGITLTQIEEHTGAGRGTSRAAVDWLKHQRVLQGRQGRPYQILISAEDAADRRLDVRPIEEQIAELRKQVAELRERLGRMEAELAAIPGRSRGGRREQPKATASGGRR